METKAAPPKEDPALPAAVPLPKWSGNFSLFEVGPKKVVPKKTSIKAATKKPAPNKASAKVANEGAHEKSSKRLAPSKKA